MNQKINLQKGFWAVFGILAFVAVLIISTDINGLLQPAQVSQPKAQTLLSKVDIDRAPLLKTLTENPLSNNPGPLPMPGMVDSIGTYFEIKDSKYLNVTLKSSEELNVFLESSPKTISLMVRAAENASSAILTIENLTPNQTYYRYQDGYDNLTVSVANSNGSYTWTQDLTQPHHVWFQEEESTIYLPGNCSIYGTWDAETATCTLNQNINQSVQLTSNNITLDCNGHSITGSGAGYGIYVSYRSGITIKNCMLDNFSAGAFFISSSGNAFSNNIVRNSQGGLAISLALSSNSTVSSNTIEFNSNGFGIRVMGSGNIVTQNTILNNGGGIELYGDIFGNNITQNTINSNNTGIFILNSGGNTLTGNTIASSTIGISFYYYTSGTPPNNILRDNILNDNQFNISFDTYAPPQSFIQDIDQSNTINEKPIYYLVNQADQTISGEAGFVGLVNSQRISVKDLILANNHEGIMLVSTNDSTVENVQLLDNILGILLIDSSRNFFKGNQIDVPESYGIGLYFSSSTDNVIMESDITVSPDTHAVAMVGYLNFDNKFYNNNFTVGNFPIFIQGGAGNVFDNGYPDGGNWWSNNTYCQDTKTGPLQNQPGSDGICDSPYNFWGGQDGYPFVEQDGWKPVSKILPDEAVALVKEVIGAPYLGDGWTWGGKGEDCSGWPIKRFVPSSEIKESYYFYDHRERDCSLEKDSGVDCSGLVFWAYNQAYFGNGLFTAEEYRGRPLHYEKAARQFIDNTDVIEKEDLKLGDFLFFDRNQDGSMDHVAMYTGGDNLYNVIHASFFTKTVTYAIYNPDTEELTTVKPTGELELLQVAAYGRVVEPRVALGIIDYSPVELIVTDPDGFITSIENSWEGSMEYQIYDINSDGDLDNLVVTGERKIGDYLITVVPKPDALLGDTHTLKAEALINDEIITIRFVENSPISDIPRTPYVLKSTETEIAPAIPAFVDFDPDTLNLKGKSKWITNYIELPHGFNVSQIDISTVRLNDTVLAEADPKYEFVRNPEIKDRDKNGLPELMIKFNRSAVQTFSETGEKVEIVITGELIDGRLFQGSDIIRVISAAKQK